MTSKHLSSDVDSREEVLLRFRAGEGVSDLPANADMSGLDIDTDGVDDRDSLLGVGETLGAGMGDGLGAAIGNGLGLFGLCVGVVDLDLYSGVDETTGEGVFVLREYSSNVVLLDGSRREPTKLIGLFGLLSTAGVFGGTV